MNDIKRLRIHPAVFYRDYDGQVILYHTANQKVFTFEGSAADVLDCFRDFNTPEHAAEILKESYETDNYDIFRKKILNFVDELSEKGILVPEHRQTVRINNLEREISGYFCESGQLYSATVEMTYKCNEKCRHCYVSKADKEEMPTEKLKDILDSLEKLKVFNVVFTGGELFTVKDAFEVLDYAYKKRFVIDIFTNGTLLKGEDYLRLKHIYPRCVHFSLYSHKAEKHDKVTQLTGSFEKTLHSIKMCAAMGMPVNIKAPIFTETMEDIPGIVALANQIGVSVELGRNITPKKNGDMTPVKMQIEGAINDRKVRNTIGDSIETINEYSEETTEADRLCGAGDHSISIDPYGKVFPCNMLQIELGDVTKQSLDEIWYHSEMLTEWRNINKRSMRNGCGDCKYTKKCIFCPGEAMMRTGSPLSRYEEACRMTGYAVENKRKGGAGYETGTKEEI